MENAVFFLLSSYSQCGVPAFLSAQHTTVHLDHSVACQLSWPYDTLLCVLLLYVYSMMVLDYEDLKVWIFPPKVLTKDQTSQTLGKVLVRKIVNQTAFETENASDKFLWKL